MKAALESEALKEAYENGLASQKDIASSFGISRSHLWKVSQALGWNYASNRSSALKKADAEVTASLDEYRRTVISEHLLEAGNLRKMAMEYPKEELDLVKKRLELLTKAARFERLTLGLPETIKGSLEKSESTRKELRIEDVLMNVNMKKLEISSF